MTYIPAHLNALTDDELISNYRISDDPLVALLVERLAFLQADLEAEIESHSETRQELEDLEEEAELEAEELRVRIYEVSEWGGENVRFFPTKREAMEVSRQLKDRYVPHMVVRVTVPHTNKDAIVAIANGDDWMIERETLVAEVAELEGMACST